MSDMAKQARAAMKAKAKSLSGGDPTQKVDSSDWTPPPQLETTAKTGLRPVSRRAFKSGGKVHGEHAKPNMGRMPRKSGGEVKKWVDAKVNRNVKDANEERAGTKHIGALKTGGRAKKMLGGPMMGGAMMAPMATPMSGAGASSMNIPAGGTAPGLANLPNVSKNALNFGVGASGSPYKKGGKVGHPDEAADKALIKKMVKPSARTGKKHGGEREARATGGNVFSGPGYPGKVPGATGGRTAHAAGGKAGKGKTNINIMIGHRPGEGAGMAPAAAMNPMAGPVKPPGLGGPAGGAPLPPMPMGMPPMPPGGAPGGAPPMPPGMMPPGGAMPRKSGGRAYHSYKDMDAGAGGGEGRIEKTEIAKRKGGIQRA